MGLGRPIVEWGMVVLYLWAVDRRPQTFSPFSLHDTPSFFFYFPLLLRRKFCMLLV